MGIQISLARLLHWDCLCVAHYGSWSDLLFLISMLHGKSGLTLSFLPTGQ